MTLPLTESLLQRLGWDDGWEAAFAEHRAAGLTPARVAVQHRGAYDLATEEGEVRASAANRFVRDDDLPGVGDWVGLDGATNLIEALLPRRTSISRKEVLQKTREQILAAIRGAATDLHFAGHDDVQPIPGLTFGEHRVSARKIDGLQLLGQRRYRARFDSLEDSGPGQDLVHVAPLKQLGDMTCAS